MNLIQKINLMPHDIKWNIAHFIDDIDIRRSFNIYNKIDINKFTHLNRIIRKCNRNHNNWIRFEFVSNFEPIYRNLDGDLLDAFIYIHPTIVRVELYLYKLRKLRNKALPPNSIYHLGNLKNSYYWQNVNIKYEF